ncbi:hypothetical protein X777_07708, partial [Ooceraea biroi]
STIFDKSTLEEMLIEEVRKRPPLYDYTLPLSVRGRHKLAELWREISTTLNGRISPDDAKKRWKSLKDTFSKAVAEGKNPVDQRDRVHKNHGNILKQCPSYVWYLQTESITFHTCICCKHNTKSGILIIQSGILKSGIYTGCLKRNRTFALEMVLVAISSCSG